MTVEKQKILDNLRKELLAIEGFKPSPIANIIGFGLGEIENCFPNTIFPTGTIHEFLAESQEDTAASEGFISGLLAKMMSTGNTCLWISRNRKLFPPSMQSFNVNPQLVIFIDLTWEKEILWVMEEALKCEGLACVIAEISDIGFSQSQRLQLATEKSSVTGILLRKDPKRSLSATACTVRWKIKPQPTEFIDGLPGVGDPRWQVNLIKVRHGHTGTFYIEWKNDQFVNIDNKRKNIITLPERNQIA